MVPMTMSKVSFEVFHCSPQPLKAGIVATAMFRRFMEISMYSQRCIIAGTLAACSVCVPIPVRPPNCSPAPLLTLKGLDGAPAGRCPMRTRAFMNLFCMCICPGRQDTPGYTRDKTPGSRHSA